MAKTTLKKIAVRFNRAPGSSSPVGVLAQQQHRVFFEYDAAWLERGLELSPFTLPLAPGLKEHTDRQFGPLPGLFDDSLPDGWGLLLMDRHFRKAGLEPAAVSPLDRLVYLGTQTMGALTYHPPAEREGVDAAVFELHQLAQQAQQVCEGKAVEVLPQLMRAGGSPGGARPKVLVGYDAATHDVISGEGQLPARFEHWIVKFPARQEEREAGPVEYAYALMAKAAGLLLPPVHLFETAGGGRFFGVRRFDRAAPNRRFHAHTFGNLIQANFRIPSTDYADLLRVTTVLTRSHQDVVRAFRLMVFNVLAHNRDDHAKNFAFVLDEATASWSLSPAYDLTYADGPGGEHTTTLEGEGSSPGLPHMLQLAARFDVSRKEALSIHQEVRQAVKDWPRHAEQAGVSRSMRQQIAGRLLV